MGNKKKRSGKTKKLPKGYYCRICGEHKANENFSGKGHAAHICKACDKKSPEQKSEDITINRIHSVAFSYLSETDIKWLKNRRNDSRPEVQELARQVFEEKFPRQTRNEIKAQLHIKNIIFYVRGEVYNEYGDECIVNTEFTADTSGKIVKKMFDRNDNITTEKSVDIGVKAARKLFNIAVHNYDIPFWDTELCHNLSNDPDIDLLPDFLNIDNVDNLDFADEFDGNNNTEQDDDNINDMPDDKVPAWGALIKYKNGTEQNIKGFDFIPNPVMELYDEFDCYFEDE